MLKKMAFLGFVLLSAFTRAQSRMDTTTSPGSTLTSAQVQAYLNGTACGDMALVAEIYRYPMPDKVLQLKKQLDLTPEQIKKITDIYNHMHSRRVQAGQSIVNNEKTLDKLFKEHKAEEGSVIFYGNRYGAYLGELRNAMLMACIETQKELTPKQLARFEVLRKQD